MRLIPDLDADQVSVRLPAKVDRERTRVEVEKYMTYVQLCCILQLTTLLSPVTLMYPDAGPSAKTMALFLDMLPKAFHDLFYAHHLANLTVARRAWDVVSDVLKPIMLLEEGAPLTPAYIEQVWDAFGETYTHFAIPWHPTRRVPPRAERLGLVMDAGVSPRVRELLAQWPPPPTSPHLVSISSYVDHYGSRLRVWGVVDNEPPDAYTARLSTTVMSTRVLYLPPSSLYVYDMARPPEDLDMLLDLLDAFMIVTHSDYGSHRCVLGLWPAAKFG
jgi:hypothetical protein